MKHRQATGTAFALAVLFLCGCAGPATPPEVRLAEQMGQKLWKAGAAESAPEAYRRYQADLRRAKDSFLRERNRLAWFRDYDPMAIELRHLIQRGGTVLGGLRRERTARSGRIADKSRALLAKAEGIENLSNAMNEGRLARRNLSKAKLMIREAGTLSTRRRYNEADKALFEAEIALKSAAAAVRPILNRYSDRKQVAQWRSWVDETIHESKSRGITAIVVDKVARDLTIYRAGLAVKTYRVGLGRNGLTDKLYAGDQATPEGRYHVVKKVPRSKYFKALLINYPNDEDRARFAQAKKRGLIPPRAGIGSLLEIHGGGDEGMTYGCISVDDRHMEEIFGIADVGTPVTIVGTTAIDNFLNTAGNEL
jgi:L,D-peptidoglycan transpeptidase YkuD (ErfK/YbiS/YcfS/YnhG family)